MTKNIPSSLKDFLYYLIIGTLIYSSIYIWQIHQDVTQDKIANEEFSLLNHPPRTQYVNNIRNSFYFSSLESKKNILDFYDKELSENKWKSDYEGETSKLGPQGRHTDAAYHYKVYTKGKVSLIISWNIAEYTTYLIKIEQR
jgi:hypothetical protein